MKVLDPERLPLRGPTVVEASAGTGKTYTITSLFLRLLLEQIRARKLQVDRLVPLHGTIAPFKDLVNAVPAS